MKKLVTSYTFDASAKTIDSADFTSLEKIQLITNVTDNIIIYNFADPAKGGALSGTVLTLDFDTTGMADVDKLQILVEDAAQTIPVTDNGGSLTIDGSVTVTGGATAANQSTANTALSAIQAAVEVLDNTVAGAEMQVDIVGAIPAGNNNIGDVDIASLPALPAGSNNIGDVDVLSLPAVVGQAADQDAATGNPVRVAAKYNNALPTYTDGDQADLQVDSRGVLRVQLYSGGSQVAYGSVADNADGVATSATASKLLTASRLYVYNGSTYDRMRGDTTDGVLVNLGANNDVGLNAGTNAIGKMLPPDADVVTHTNYAKKFYTNAGAVTDGIIWSPAAGKRWHVVSMFINVSAAATITLEDDKSGGDEVVMKMEIAANSGMTINYGELYPLASGEDAADLLITTTAGNVYVTVTGYEI